MALVMTQFREKFPQFDDMPDAELATYIHKMYYSDKSFGEFANAIGYDDSSADSGFVRGLKDMGTSISEVMDEFMDKTIEDPIERKKERDRSQLLQELTEKADPEAEKLFYPPEKERNAEQRILEERNYQISRAMEGDTGIDWDRMAGNILNPVNLFLGSKLPVSNFFPATAATAALGGAGLTALSTPTFKNPGEVLPEKAKQAALGAAGGALFSPLSHITSSMGRAAVRPEMESMRRMGVNPTAWQALGGRAKQFEESLTGIPLLGGGISSAHSRGRAEYVKGLLDDALEPIGQKAENIGFVGVSEAQRKVSEAYNNAAQLVSNIQLGRTALNDISSLRNNLKFMPKETEDAVERFIVNNVQRRMSSGNRVEIRNFKDLDSNIGARIANSSNKDTRDAFRFLQNIFRDQARRQHPEYSHAKEAADAAYAKLVRVEGAARMAMDSDGVFTPMQYLTAVRQAESSTRGRDFAAGNALMQKTALEGVDVLSSQPTKVSGFDKMYAGLGYRYLFNQAEGLGAAVGSLGYSPGVQKALVRTLRNFSRNPSPKAAAYSGFGVEQEYNLWK